MSQIKASVTGTSVQTGKVRISFPNIFQPRKADPNKPNEPSKYGCQLLIPKGDTDTLNAIKQACRAAAEAKWGAKAAEMVRSGAVKLPLRDGDQENAKRKAMEKKELPEQNGHFFVNVTSKYQPAFVSRSNLPITKAEDLRAGDYARVQLNAFVYQQQGNTGVSLGIQCGQKLESGEPLGGAGSDPTAVFDKLDDEPAAAGAAAGTADDIW